jgi:carbamoyl-phosphate synthase small subunit
VDRAKKAGAMVGADLVKDVTCSAAYPWTTAPTVSSGGKKKVALLDFGAKFNIMNSLAGVGCEVSVFPARTALADLLKKV